MTVLALQAKITCVDFWFSMATTALDWGSIENLVHVTGVTGDGCMLPIQHEKTAVVQIDHAVDTIMAGQAVRPELGLVVGHKGRGLDRVTLQTGFQCETKLETVDGCMTTRTPDRGAGVIKDMAIQAEAGLFIVIEPLAIQPHQGRPILRRMTGGTITRIQPGVRRRFLVAVLAGQRGAFEIPFQMAIDTRQGRVPAFQGETGRSVIEVGHAVDSIVAGHAILAKILQVGHHKNLVVFRMAVHTALGIQLESRIPTVTGITIHRQGMVIKLVPAQAKNRLLVIVMLEGRGGNIGIPAKMIGVATAALLDFQQVAVCASLRYYLFENRGVAVQA